MSVPDITTTETETAFTIAAELLHAQATQPSNETVAPGSGARDAQKLSTKRLSTASEVADLLGVSRKWVYEHAGDLGAIRMGAGPKPRMRFDPDECVARLRALSAPRPVEAVSSPAKRRCAAPGRPKLSDLLREGGHRGA
jgi:hypothetical protein